jgi:hypothetical protein
MKIRSVELKLFHVNGRTEGQTDRHDVTVAFRNFAIGPIMPYKDLARKFT